jgi:hypothetical protein
MVGTPNIMYVGLANIGSANIGEAMNNKPARILVIGRSPSVLLTAVDLMRGKGHHADATNQFEQVLTDYDVSDLDVVVFGGMVPADTKQVLREEIAKRNVGVTFVQGLAGIPGVLAAQVDAILGENASAGTEITYDPVGRTVRVTLPKDAPASVEAFWATSFTPPEPTSTSMTVFDGPLAAGTHDIALPQQVPSVASFAAVTLGQHVQVFTVGAMPESVTRLAPNSPADQRLPDVAAVATQ